VINVVVTGGAGVFQLLDMEAVRNPDTVRINPGGGRLHVKNAFMTSDAIRINLVQLGRKARMFPSALKRKDVNAWHQGMACRMTLRTVNLWMIGRLLPKGGFSLLMMTGDAKLLLSRGVGG